MPREHFEKPHDDADELDRELDAEERSYDLLQEDNDAEDELKEQNKRKNELQHLGEEENLYIADEEFAMEEEHHQVITHRSALQEMAPAPQGAIVAINNPYEPSISSREPAVATLTSVVPLETFDNLFKLFRSTLDEFDADRSSLDKDKSSCRAHFPTAAIAQQFVGFLKGLCEHRAPKEIEHQCQPYFGKTLVDENQMQDAGRSLLADKLNPFKMRNERH